MAKSGLCGSDRMVVGFMTSYAIHDYHHWCREFTSCSGEVYSIQHYVIKFVIDLRQVGSFLWFPPAIKLTAMIIDNITEIMLKVSLNTIKPTKQLLKIETFS
jgi:hypothetical protein